MAVTERPPAPDGWTRMDSALGDYKFVSGDRRAEVLVTEVLSDGRTLYDCTLREGGNPYGRKYRTTSEMALSPDDIPDTVRSLGRERRHG